MTDISTQELMPQPKFKKGQLVNDAHTSKQFVIVAIVRDDDNKEWLYSWNGWHLIAESDLTIAEERTA